MTAASPAPSPEINPFATDSPTYDEKTGRYRDSQGKFVKKDGQSEQNWYDFNPFAQAPPPPPPAVNVKVEPDAAARKASTEQTKLLKQMLEQMRKLNRIQGKTENNTRGVRDTRDFIELGIAAALVGTIYLYDGSVGLWNTIAESKAGQFLGIEEIGQNATNKKDPDTSGLDRTPLKEGDKVGDWVVTSGRGDRVNPVHGVAAFHHGVDLAKANGDTMGQPAYAPYMGSVECKFQAGGAGNYAIVLPQDGKNPEFTLMHLSKCIPGEISPGSIFGYAGNTGGSTGAHYHIEQRNGKVEVTLERGWAEILLGVSTPSNAADFIANLEGFHSTPYWDYQQWTWGYGTKAPGPGGSISQDDAMRELKKRIAQDERTIKRLVQRSLTEGQMTALLSFQFNTGALEGSELLSKLNAGDVAGAAAEFDRWVNAGGQTLPGLVSRRQAEKKLFLGN